MSRIKGKETGLEKMVFKELRKQRIYFAKHVKSVPGRPDIVKRSLKKVVFIDGDFWHGWHFSKWKRRVPPFWQEKIEKNRQRDMRNFRRLKKAGWKYIRIWEHELERNREDAICRIIDFLRS